MEEMVGSHHNLGLGKQVPYIRHPDDFAVRHRVCRPRYGRGRLGVRFESVHCAGGIGR
jgi:hypothetical protein